MGKVFREFSAKPKRETEVISDTSLESVVT